MTNIILIAIATCLAIVLIAVGVVTAHWALGNGDINKEIKAKRYKLK